jgi:anti-anti-sigma factor
MDRSGLSVHTELRDPVVVATLGGDLDASTSGTLERMGLDRAPAPVRLVVDLDDLDILDSSGLGLLYRMWRRIVEAHGRCAFVCNDKVILRILEIAGMRDHLPLWSDVDDAIADAAATPDP